MGELNSHYQVTFSCFLMWRHNTDKMAALNDSVTSFTPSADTSLGVETLPFTSSGRFVRGVPLYRTILFSFFMESHVHHVQSCALPRKHRRMCWNGTGSCYVNKSAMSHMQSPLATHMARKQVLNLAHGHKASSVNKQFQKQQEAD